MRYLILTIPMFVAQVVIAQLPPPLTFYPYHVGDVWQYRDASTNEIVLTRYMDTTWTDTLGSTFLQGRQPPGWDFFDRIDSAGNVFNLTFQPDYPRYKLGADSGDSWIAGLLTPEETLKVMVTNIYERWVFGAWRTTKVFTFTIYRPPPWQPFWLGDDHLSAGFGRVFSLIEGGSAPFLAGAIIDSVTWGTIVSVEEDVTSPSEFALFQNYPNPFNPTTTISYDLGLLSHVKLSIYNLLGEEIALLVDGYQDAGYHAVQFDGTNFASGVLFYRLETKSLIQTKRMLYIK